MRSCAARAQESALAGPARSWGRRSATRYCLPVPSCRPSSARRIAPVSGTGDPLQDPHGSQESYGQVSDQETRVWLAFTVVSPHPRIPSLVALNRWPVSPSSSRLCVCTFHMCAMSAAGAAREDVCVCVHVTRMLRARCSFLNIVGEATRTLGSAHSVAHPQRAQHRKAPGPESRRNNHRRARVMPQQRHT